MKKIFLAFTFFVVSLQAISQCDKKIKWYAAKGEMYDTNGALLDTKNDSIFLETDAQKISLRFQSDNNDLEGIVKEKFCNWKEPFKDGKTIYHTTTLIDGQTSDATFTIEAKDGTTILWVEIEIRQGRKFKIYLYKYEEIK